MVVVAGAGAEAAGAGALDAGAGAVAGAEAGGAGSPLGSVEGSPIFRQIISSRAGQALWFDARQAGWRAAEDLLSSASKKKTKKWQQQQLLVPCSVEAVGEGAPAPTGPAALRARRRTTDRGRRDADGRSWCGRRAVRGCHTF